MDWFSVSQNDHLESERQLPRRLRTGIRGKQQGELTAKGFRLSHSSSRGFDFYMPARTGSRSVDWRGFFYPADGLE
jgi:hypothetical protein